MAAQMTWAYSSRVEPNRQKLLLSAPDFGCIATRILDEMEIIHFALGRGYRPEVKGCKRAEFKLRVEEDTFDLFFNSRRGYLGQYHESVSVGQSANAELISKLYRNLTAHVQGHQELARIERSLTSGSAKVWIDEEGRRKQKTDVALIEELLVEPWLSAASRYTSDPQKYPEEAKALDGVRAPTGTILDVKGAFIDEEKNERIPEDKKDRSRQIHLYGFS